MRLNLTPLLVLTAVFVACGGTGDNFGDGGDEGYVAPQNDASTGDEYASYDNYQPNTDTGSGSDTGGGMDTGGGCSIPCTSDTMCQSACGGTVTYCCDVPTSTCYSPTSGTCPAPVKDAGGGDSSMY